MKILLADDDPCIRVVLTEILNGAGYEVAAEGTGRLAWERLQAENADLAVLDVKMPEMDGFELLRNIRSDERFNNMPVLMLSVRTVCSDQVEGYETGADDYLAKPFDRNILLARLNVLARRILKK